MTQGEGHEIFSTHHDVTKNFLGFCQQFLHRRFSLLQITGHSLCAINSDNHGFISFSLSLSLSLSLPLPPSLLSLSLSFSFSRKGCCYTCLNRHFAELSLNTTEFKLLKKRNASFVSNIFVFLNKKHAQLYRKHVFVSFFFKSKPLCTSKCNGISLGFFKHSCLHINEHNKWKKLLLDKHTHRTNIFL